MGPVKGLTSFRLPPAKVISALGGEGFPVLALLALSDSSGGLKSLFNDPDDLSALLVIPPAPFIALCTLRPFELGLRHMGDSWINFAVPTTALGSGLNRPDSLEEEEHVILI